MPLVVLSRPVRVLGLEQWQAAVIDTVSRAVLYHVTRWSETAARRAAERWIART